MNGRATHFDRQHPNMAVRVIRESESHVDFVSTLVSSWPRELFDQSFEPIPPSEADREEHR